MNEEKSIEGTSTIIWCKLRAKVFMYDHNTKNSMQFAYNIPYIMREWAKILRNSSQYEKKNHLWIIQYVQCTCSFLFLQYFFLRSDSFLLRHIKNLWNSFSIHYKKTGHHTSILGHWKSQCTELTITFHYYVILWNYQIRPCLFFYGPSLNLIRRQTPTLTSKKLDWVLLLSISWCSIIIFVYPFHFHFRTTI